VGSVDALRHEQRVVVARADSRVLLTIVLTFFGGGGPLPPGLHMNVTLAVDQLLKRVRW
jgi:hypothetical protein